MTLKRVKPQGELKMGLTHVAVKIGNLGSKTLYDAKFLVDTGAVESMAPASELRRVGIEPVGKRMYELASGELREYEYGLAELRFMDEITSTDIIFGPENIEPILGVIALEGAGFIVDPKNQTLRKLKARPLKRVA
ncbi:MAG TPA: aspartyl protease family protein [Pyrinomonadaceae bacterium]|nr:aspartyl protease family protein [Pyrinomonadaceae bacterium]